MTIGTLITIVFGIVVVLIVAGVILRRRPRRLKADKFMVEWKDLQLFCRDKSTWPTALLHADRLLDKALKKRKFKGKTMGERLVSAQRSLSNNDGIWFAHNLCKKVMANPRARLKEDDVKAALFAFRQALRDIGALQFTPSDHKEAKRGK